MSSILFQRRLSADKEGGEKWRNLYNNRGLHFRKIKPSMLCQYLFDMQDRFLYPRSTEKQLFITQRRNRSLRTARTAPRTPHDLCSSGRARSCRAVSQCRCASGNWRWREVLNRNARRRRETCESRNSRATKLYSPSLRPASYFPNTSARPRESEE